LSQTAAFAIGADQNAVFSFVVVGIRMQLHGTEHLSAFGIDRRQYDRARVIELCQTGDELMAKILRRLEKTPSPVFFADLGEERAIHDIVLGPHRTDENLGTIGQSDRAVSLCRIGKNGETWMSAVFMQLAAMA
jgi:hypothetical protein